MLRTWGIMYNILMKISKTKVQILVWQKIPQNVANSIKLINDGCKSLGISVEAHSLNKKMFSKEKFEKLIAHLEIQKNLDLIFVHSSFFEEFQIKPKKLGKVKVFS